MVPAADVSDAEGSASVAGRLGHMRSVVLGCMESDDLLTRSTHHGNPLFADAGQPLKQGCWGGKVRLNHLLTDHCIQRCFDSQPL